MSRSMFVNFTPEMGRSGIRCRMDMGNHRGKRTEPEPRTKVFFLPGIQEIQYESRHHP
jgi:hypothetical protein